MEDRVSTNFLQNGALRYGEYNSSGELVGYHYFLLADEPTVEGTVLNKANILPDSVAEALGLDNPTPADAFMAVSGKHFHYNGDMRGSSAKIGTIDIYTDVSHGIAHWYGEITYDSNITLSEIVASKLYGNSIGASSLLLRLSDDEEGYNVSPSKILSSSCNIKSASVASYGGAVTEPLSALGGVCCATVLASAANVGNKLTFDVWGEVDNGD